jgi:cell division ATPase FtsA
LNKRDGIVETRDENGGRSRRPSERARHFVEQQRRMLQIVPVVLEKQRKKKLAEMAGARKGKLYGFADGSKQLSGCRGIARRRFDEPVRAASPGPSSPTRKRERAPEKEE